MPRHPDPTRWHFLEALAARIQTEHGTVQHLLRDKLDKALTDYAAHLAQARQQAAEVVHRLSTHQPTLSRELRRLFAAGDYRGVHRLDHAHRQPTRSAALADLNQHLKNLTRDGAASPVPASSTAEMKSLQRFRQTWSRLSAQDLLAQAIERGPDNAGPLNTHMLTLRSLSMMQALSPEYLWRFLSHIDTLLWLSLIHI